MARHIFTGSGVPAFTPTAVGQHYIDTTNNIAYTSTGTVSSSDWKEEGGVSDWGDIGGTLSDQTDLQGALDLKADLASISVVGLSNDYDDLDNLPVIPSAAAWGGITGTLSSQTDLQTVLNLKLEAASIADFETTTELNSRDTANRDRANHSGTQAISTIDNLATELTARQNTITAFDKAILYQASVTPGDIQGIPDWSINPVGGLTQTKLQTTNNGIGQTINNWISNIKNDVASPDQNYTLHYNRANIDVDDQGFSLGSSGRSFAFISNDFFHDKEADIGEVVFINNGFNIGLNAAGPIDVRGFSYAYGFGQVRDNVTITGAMQGYGFQPFFESGVVIDSASNLTAFYDTTTAAGSNFSFYTSASFSPTLGGIQEDRGMTSININPNVGEFFVNAGYQGLVLSGTFGNFGASGFFGGISINPTISSVPNSVMLNINPTVTGDNITGINVNMNNATGTNVLAAQFIGDVDIQGSLNFTGSLSIGKLNAFANETVVDGSGQPTVVHGLISGLTATASTTVANADMIGVNTAALINIGDNAILTSGPFQLGLSALALPAVVNTGAGSDVEHVCASVFAINLDPGSTGGTIGELRGCRTVFIPNGVTTITKSVGYIYDAPFGNVSSNAFGFYEMAGIKNFLKGSLKIGGIEDVSDSVVNSDVQLEIHDRQLVLARLTTTERNAMTAVNGGMIYNVTDDKFQGYAAGSWVNLH